MWTMQNYLSGVYSADQLAAYVGDACLQHGQTIDPIVSHYLAPLRGRSTPAINDKIAALIDRLETLRQRPEELSRCIETAHPTKRAIAPASSRSPLGVHLPSVILGKIFSFLDRADLDNFCRSCRLFYGQKAAILAHDKEKVNRFFRAQIEHEDIVRSFLEKCFDSRYETPIRASFPVQQNPNSKEVLAPIAKKFPLILSFDIFMEDLSDARERFQEVISLCHKLQGVRIYNLKDEKNLSTLSDLLLSCRHIEELYLPDASSAAVLALAEEMKGAVQRRKQEAQQSPVIEKIAIEFASEPVVPIQRRTEAVFEFLTHFSQVKTVVLTGFDRHYAEIDLSRVTLPRTLEFLHLGQSQLPAGSFQTLATSCPHLKHLSFLTCTTFEETSLELETLRLGSCPLKNLTKLLSNLPKLTRFEVENPHVLVIEQALARGLRFLSIVVGDLTVAGLKNILTNLPDLAELTLSQLRPYEMREKELVDEVKASPPLTHLKSLDLSNNRDSFLLKSFIELCPNLQILNLTQSLQPSSLENLRLSPTIRDLNLSGPHEEISSSNLNALFTKLPNLIVLNLRRCNFSRSEGLSPFETIPRGVESLNLAHTHVTVDDLKTIFARCRKLKSIWIPQIVTGEDFGKMNLPATLEEIHGVKINLLVIQLQCPQIARNSYDN